MSDCVPKVSREDVERIVRRDFPAHLHDSVQRELGGYKSLGAKEVERVQLAILKLSNGKFDQIRRFVSEANGDYRDVIAPAEYPRLNALGFVGVEKLSQLERKQLSEDDWRDYQEWFSRGSDAPPLTHL
jgi:hypothetical protein